ncbi:hypothetical protein [Fluviicola sp.]|jgi:hypothetical protein|uniref:hypothetical protein n=1 Tax=Fluviicola sp. TaxID=1917219 RepID=UPI00281BDA49|nr:hypothetical protein [Fluviicola sp.]MDR0802541.1 hypothetical protein [Fluviicola sp.]
MKKLIYGIAFLVVTGGAVLVACNKQNPAPNRSTEKETTAVVQKAGVNYEKSSIELSPDEIEEIGILHNNLLHQVFFEPLVSNNYQLEVKKRFLELKGDNLTFIKSELENEKISNFDLQFINENFQDEISVSFIESGMSIVNNGISLDEIIIDLKRLKTTIMNDHENFNRTTALLFVEVAINSASFWLDTEIGSNVIASTPHPQGLSKWVKGLIVADGLGASGAFTGYGLLAGITGPMGWGALIATVGFSAAWSSATYALT